MKLPSVKLPDTSKAVVNTSMTVKECEEACLRNCSCMAYTSADDSRGGSGCIALYGELLDTRLYPSGGQDVYYRADAVALGIASFNIALPFKTYMLRHSHINYAGLCIGCEYRSPLLLIALPNSTEAKAS